jgi:hypothetical protein
MRQYQTEVPGRCIVEITPLTGGGSDAMARLRPGPYGFTLTEQIVVSGNVVTAHHGVNVHFVEGWCLIDAPRHFPSTTKDEGQPRLTATAAHVCALMGVPLSKITGLPGLLKGLTCGELTSAELEDAPRAVRKLGAENWRRIGVATGVPCFNDRAFVEIHKLTAYLAGAEIREPNNRTATNSGHQLDWADRLAQQARRALRGQLIEAVELNVSSIQCGGPDRAVGDKIRAMQGNLNGICAHIEAIYDGRRQRIGAARAYQVETPLGDWFKLGDPIIPEFIRRNRIHEKLVIARVLACLNMQAEPSRIVWGPGAHAAKAVRMGLREVTEPELKLAPRAIRFCARVSKKLAKKAGIELVTGLFCFSHEGIQNIIERSREIITDGMIYLRTVSNHSPAVPRLCGRQLQALVFHMTTAPRFGVTMPADHVVSPPTAL